MASFLKGFVRPRLQLLALMLIIGTGLLPKNSMAEDGGGSDDPASDGASGGSGSADAIVRAGKSVKCYEQACNEMMKEGVLVEECLKKPDKMEADCETGFCSLELEYKVEDGKKTASAIRSCAKEEELKCLKDAPENCLVLDMNKEEDEKKSKDYDKCVGNDEGGEKRDKSKLKPEDSYTQIRCTCEGALCNDRVITPASAGVKHLGWNVALVGALLVSISPLWNLFLAG